MSDSTVRPARRSWLAFAFAVAVAGGLLLSATPLTQSDGDLFAHIALGREILVQGPPARITPAWGSAVLFVRVHAAGGLSLVAACTAVVAGLAHALAVRLLMQQSSSVRTASVAAMIGVTLASSHWLARPHAFTLLGVAALMTVLHTRRHAFLATLIPLFTVWANLHGGWIFGAVVLLCDSAGRTLRARRPTGQQREVPSGLRWRWLVTTGAMLATMITPYGLGLHGAVLQTLTDPDIAQYIDEYRRPSFASPVDALFLAIVALTIPVLMRLHRPIPLERTLIIVASAAAALEAGRNIALFAFTGWPLLVMHAAPAPASTRAATGSWRSRRHSVHRVVRAFAPIAAIGVIVSGLGILAARSGAHGALAVPVDATRFPVGAVAQLKRDARSERLLTTWSWSGYIPYAWRGHRAWFDPLAFSPNEMHVLRTLLRTGPSWRSTLDSLHIGVVIVPPGAPLDRALSADPDWQHWYEDHTAVGYRRTRALTATPNPPDERRRHRG